ncbi:manganese efflux pump MntP family protein [Alishewanella sp. 16-MA]|uniref:Putative manganese efflux pump MntP n=1 Tax=Alishewanella maricola TaxID=2795740 RepID=A0ABS8C2I5_9ALTE|nr:manganese efflux pump MntP family protein [Alishewanella maricola]MCB5226547.1 manganese efflux pump MntP family protein [Alishewanella maricola]MDP4945017.1 manganese efflux pump MntP family protein [Alishewanella sp.]MDP5036957.1 manganese efflux pump MntP family protein [Alishewanella sp.]
MNPIPLILLAFAMSTDAFAAAIGKGATLKKPRLIEAFKIGLIFGFIEAITPLVGWLIGKSASEYVEAWDHWIAFSLLTILGLHMIYEGTKPAGNDEEQETGKSLFRICLTAFSTSIDAMVVGVSLAFINVNIWIAAALIGFATTLMVTIGIMLGRAIGSVIGHRAEIFGGLTLIAVGSLTLYSHL